MTDPDCAECNGEGYVFEQDRYSSDGCKQVPCPVCVSPFEPEYNKEVDE